MCRAKRESVFVKGDVSGGDNTTCTEVKTAVASMIGRISQENTS